MADLAKDISDLQKKIERYEVALENATSSEVKIMFGGLITELLKQQTKLKGT
jgi:hypothetical protein